MANHMIPRNHCPVFAVLLGVLACGGAKQTAPGTGGASNTDPASGGAATGTPRVPSGGSGANGSMQGVEPSPMGGAGSPSNGTGANPTRASATGAGPFQVTTLARGLRDGPDYGTQTLYVPQGAQAPFAAVAIVPGYEELESSIQPWGPFLASHGIVALTLGTNTPTDSAEARASALLDALETIKAEDSRAGSPLAGKLARDRLGVMGWSMGGAGTLIAAESTPSLKAAITMAAWSPGDQFSDDEVPTLLFAGSADEVSGGQAQDFFASLPSTTPKMLYEVRGGPHEIGNDPQNANGEIGRYGLSWLEVFLVGDERYLQFLEEVPAQASDFRQNLSSTP
jgi:dienelactone hydrolase